MKKFISAVLYFLILSFIGATFSSFVIPADIIVQVDGENLAEFFRENWAVIALIISEIAALLPGKPKGVLQACLLIFEKVLFRKNVSLKNFLL